jgi:hypothetical protein
VSHRETLERVVALAVREGTLTPETLERFGVSDALSLFEVSGPRPASGVTDAQILERVRALPRG